MIHIKRLIIAEAAQKQQYSSVEYLFLSSGTVNAEIPWHIMPDSCEMDRPSTATMQEL